MAEPTGPKPNGQSKPARRAFKYLAGLVAALIAAAAVAIGTGLGSRVVDRIDPEAPKSDPTKPEPPLISSSAGEVITECQEWFVEEESVSGIVSGEVPTVTDWVPFFESQDAMVIHGSEVEVSIQGESARPITLTGIDFTVQRQPRPPGATFSAGCGGPHTGRFIDADLDQSPPQVVSSSKDPNEYVGNPTSLRPITFPWTVSVSDPLILYIGASTETCYCTWRAFLPWRSGSRTGRITIDNDGKGYPVIGPFGLPGYSSMSGKWEKTDVYLHVD